MWALITETPAQAIPGELTQQANLLGQHQEQPVFAAMGLALQ